MKSDVVDTRPLRTSSSEAVKDTISVIVRTCDRAAVLSRALSSIAAQTSSPADVIVINEGGHREAVRAVVAKFRDALDVTLIENLTPLGRGGALNAGLAAAQGEWVAILDDDDTWSPEFLGKALAAAKSQGVSGAVVRTTMILERDGDGNVELARELFKPGGLEVGLQFLALGGVFTINAFLYRRSCALELGGYRTDLEVLEDWDFNLRFLARYPVAQLPEQLAFYHKCVKPATAARANTDLNLHARVKQRLIDEWLRADLQSGRFGLGSLVMMAESRSMLEQLGFLLRWRARVQRWFARLRFQR